MFDVWCKFENYISHDVFGDRKDDATMVLAVVFYRIFVTVKVKINLLTLKLTFNL